SFLSVLRRPPTPTLFPYTTLFRSDPEAAATGLLVYRLIRHWGLALDREAATCIFTALSGDTGSFRYSNTTAEALEAARQAVLARSEEHTSELQSREKLVCRLLLEK